MDCLVSQGVDGDMGPAGNVGVEGVKGMKVGSVLHVTAALVLDCHYHTPQGMMGDDGLDGDQGDNGDPGSAGEPVRNAHIICHRRTVYNFKVH
jgi:hypothetical protein